MTKFYFSAMKHKIILLLLAGTAIYLSRSGKTQWRILRNLPKAFKSIDRVVLNRIVKEFYHDRLVDFRITKDGTAIVTLTERGKHYALRYKIDELVIHTPLHWDKKWRIVIFDIPEKYKRAREALRDKLAELGFIQLQKSVWILPYPCKDTIDFIVEIFEIRRFVLYLEVTSITNEAKLKLQFKLV